MKAIITVKELINIAQNLKSEHGENKEYDRALIELITEASGLSITEGYGHIAKLIKIKLREGK